MRRVLKCMLEFVAVRVGCHLDLVGTHKVPQFPSCDWVRLTRETGCYGKCQYKEYKFNKVTVNFNL